MIDGELAIQAVPLLSTVLAILVEDEQDTMLRGFGAGRDADLATDLVTLGEDFTVIARALVVILRRSQPDGGGA